MELSLKFLILDSLNKYKYILYNIEVIIFTLSKIPKYP